VLKKRVEDSFVSITGAKVGQELCEICMSSSVATTVEYEGARIGRIYT
jgi:hypothetical protein